ncbi:MAG TPA: glycosyltransferase [Candidatus Margulisbacteria bacterium]|nr:MAG: hypothetical protein A2X43_11720 [Candidatus Margulisbacteria bacterium GWD2_39_127]OGI01808.1 MAG: hypothetical protein A2X42_04245 [Candidatus Margulisbacteria bacterium GWF2_38_17]OGI10130.1 MAG: hypothetical protein A2X41_00965 [Candidatus Margulisbacteria bacterium GWE2_39_32]HAR63794.1 glycosyltransferase [Candidatus Margulisiibacteriota bacterium]HCT83589.1 glycosyltransferase [Candidatus Margulisiibacteriota bacterium]
MHNENIKLFNVTISNLSMIDAINQIIELAKSNKKAYVVTPNIDHIVMLQNDTMFKEVYDHAEMVLADGMPLIWASKILNTPIIEKVSGSDLFVRFAPFAAHNNIKLFLLGAAEGIAEQAKNNLCEEYPEIQITGVYSPPYGFEKDEQENLKIIDMINNSDADVLFVGLGSPKQEYWMYRNYHKLDTVKVSLGVGASFDFVAGKVQRAPVWMQKTGLEWFYRLVQEPQRLWRRYLINDMKFIPILMHELINAARTAFNKVLEAKSVLTK